MPSPTLSLVWLPEDAYAGRCTIAEIGHARPESALAGVADVQAMARHLSPHVLASLALLARSGGYGAVEAARLLLAYAWGPPGAQASPPPAPAPADPPGWKPDPGRLSYDDMPRQ